VKPKITRARNLPETAMPSSSVSSSFSVILHQQPVVQQHSDDDGDNKG
jgi:hypothetical protein